MTLVVADQYFNTDSCVGSVQVLDTLPPTPVCQDLTVSLDANGFVNLNPVDQFVTNSSSDFSTTQGQNGWFYGVYSAFNVYNFDTLTYNGFVWNNPSAGAILNYPQLDANGGHPQFEGLRWAVRRWVSTVDGQIRISGDFYDRDITGGDGAHVRIFKNGVQIYEYLNIPAGSVNYSIEIKATAGDRFDFVIDPKFDAANDDTHFIINIDKMGINNGSYDNCTIDSLSISPSTLDCSNLGVNTVILVATDNQAINPHVGYNNRRSHITYADDSVSACDPYTWIDGITYYSDTDTAFYLSGSSSNGCFDTISHLVFNLIETDTNVYLLGNTIYALDSTYTYQWFDCDNQSIINGQTGYFYTNIQWKLCRNF